MVNELVTQVVERFPYLIAGIIVILVFWLFSKLVKAIFLSASKKTHLDNRLRHKKNFINLRNDYQDEGIEFEDEMRFGTRTRLGKKWTLYGVCPVGEQKIIYERA